VSADTGMKLVLFAGALTFSNEWLQTKQINFRVPVATVLAAAATAGIGRVSSRGATALGLMALIVAATTPLGNKSPVQEISSLVNGSSSTSKMKPTTTTVPTSGAQVL
jgi:hypothetical protein